MFVACRYYATDESFSRDADRVSVQVISQLGAVEGYTGAFGARSSHGSSPARALERST